MPRVPTYDSFQASPNALPQSRLTVPDIPDIAGQQTQQMARGMNAAGDAMTRISLDVAQQANQLRVDDALNQAKEQALRLTYDKQVGFTNIKGQAALERPDGKPLAEEYGDTLKKSVDKISGTLGNDAQRQAFSLHANNLLTSFRSQAIQHEAGEFKNYSLSVSEGVQSTALREIGLNWRDPEAVGAAVERIKAETYRQGQLLGKSAEWQESQARKLTSNGHKTALLSALEQNDPSYAEGYLNKFSKQMDADDILMVRGHITKEMDARVGTTAASEVIRQLAPRIQTSDAERAFNIAVGTESGGKQFAKDGTPLTSPKGAIGIAQVMPATAPEAAKLAGLEWDENRYRTDPAYNKAIGLAYFQKQLQTNGGDLAKSYAAYNAGPGALQEAIKKADRSVSLNKNDPTVPVKQWLDFLPLETRNYVAKNMKEYDAGQGQAARPTFAEIDEKLRADPRLANSPSRYKTARVEAERMFEEQTKAIKQREDESVAAAMRAVVENGGRYSDLPASVRAAIPPKEIDNVIGFAQKIAKGDDTTSPWLYSKLTSNPGQLASMSDDAFYALRRELSESDFKHFSQERAKASGKSVTGAAGDLNTGAIKQTLDERLRMLQIDPSPKDDGGSDAARIGGIRRFVDQYFYSAQRESGKKFSDAEVAQHIDTLFAKNAEFRGWFSTKSGPMLGMKVGDLAGDVKDNLKAAFKRQGIDNPTDAQLMNAYWNVKVSRK